MYVLIIFLVGLNSGDIQTVGGFTTLDSCEKAAERVRMIDPWGDRNNIATVCIPGGN